MKSLLSAFIVFGIVTVFLFCSCKGNPSEKVQMPIAFDFEAIDPFLFTTSDTTIIYGNEKVLIAKFIDSIASKEKGLVGGWSPIVSTIPKYNYDNYIGIRCAYKIEMILALKERLQKVLTSDTLTLNEAGINHSGVAHFFALLVTSLLKAVG